MAQGCFSLPRLGAALNIIACITVLMRRRSAALRSGLSRSCSVCYPTMRSRFIATAASAHTRWLVANLPEGRRLRSMSVLNSA
jgi:hypothetical protein